jgi:hypothetical protein
MRRSAGRAWSALALPPLVALAACSRNPAPEAAADHHLYPGAAFSARIDHDGPLEVTAEYGRLVLLDGGRTVWYEAPLDSKSDSYSVTDGSGKVVLAGTVVVDIPPAATLEITDGDATQRVAGRYGDVEFEAAASSDSAATATLRTSGAADALQVVVTDGRAHLEWRGQQLDGYGALSDAEAAALHEISTGTLARGLTMVALDLGCREDQASLPLSVHAALLFPWQMILKYEVAARGRVIEHFMADARCRFSGFAEEDADEPLNPAVLWDSHHVIPMAHFIFPFDGDGELREPR